MSSRQSLHVSSGERTLYFCLAAWEAARPLVSLLGADLVSAPASVARLWVDGQHGDQTGWRSLFLFLKTLSQ